MYNGFLGDYSGCSQEICMIILKCRNLN
uniref:Uncharacterized protein n=1 Tax=Arundo donax TaxID=35708 RepID=A0A0A9A8R4_ARUDO